MITVTFGNDKMGSLLIVKKDAVTGAPLSDAEFLVTNSDGGVIGNANGKYVTDSAGTIRIDELEPGMTVIVKESRAKEVGLIQKFQGIHFPGFNLDRLRRIIQHIPILRPGFPGNDTHSWRQVVNVDCPCRIGHK